MGDRRGNLSAAVAQLSALMQGVRASRVLESPAMLPPDAPGEWNLPYLNMAVSGETELSPPALFVEIKRIEQALGRVPRGNWGPREIDIDILAVGDLVFEDDGLTIPHRGLLARDFALLPLIDVAPDWRYPAGPYAGQLASAIAAAKGFHLSDRLQDRGRLALAG